MEVFGRGVHEQANIRSIHPQQCVSTARLKINVVVADAGETDDIFIGVKVHHHLSLGRTITSAGNQPELVKALTAVQVVDTCAIENVEDVVVVAAENTVVAGADVEDIEAIVTAEAVAVIRRGEGSVVTGTTDDHLSLIHI